MMATTKGAPKWNNPYGIHAKMSSTELMELERIALKSSPYKMVSIAGKTFTLIGYLLALLKVEDVKYKANHVKIGQALKKN